MSSNLVYVLSKVQFGEVTETAFRDAMDPLVDSLRKEYPIFDQKKEFRVFEVQVTPQGQDVVEETLTIKLIDKLKTLEILNKMLGYYELDNRQKTKVFDVSSATPDQLNTMLSLFEQQGKDNEPHTIDLN